MIGTTNSTIVPWGWEYAEGIVNVPTWTSVSACNFTAKTKGLAFISCIIEASSLTTGLSSDAFGKFDLYRNNEWQYAEQVPTTSAGLYHTALLMMSVHINEVVEMRVFQSTSSTISITGKMSANILVLN